MRYKKYLKLLLLSLMTSTFIACGGGGSSSSNDDDNISSNPTPLSMITPTPTLTPTVTPTPTPTPKINEKPIANAGTDQNVTFGNQIVLDASRSYDDGTIVKYEWRESGKIIGTEQSTVIPTMSKEGEYAIELTVTDDKGEIDTDSMKLITYSDSIVLLKTNQGDIKLKMKSDIAPKAVENFVTHSKNGYYDGLMFHRVIRNFMIQGGDPKGSGRGGESIWGTPFEDEFDSSVTFDKPYLLAMANSGKNTNGSQFFITVAPTTWLNNKHTIFGEVMEGTETVDKIEVSGNSRSKIEKSIVVFELPN